MRFFWISVNIFLALCVCIAGVLLLSHYQGFFGKAAANTQRKPLSAKGEKESVQLAGAISFRVTTNALCQDEAILVEPGEPFRFTLRPGIDLPSSVSGDLTGYVETHPSLADGVQIDWKSEGGGTIVAKGGGRYEFVPPETGGDVLLRFRGSLTLPGSAPAEGNLTGETSLRLLCPIPWERMPDDAREGIGKYPSVGSKSSLAPFRSFYTRPTHFYLVTGENQNWKISPHFRLGDFDLHFDYDGPDAPDTSHLPQYVALNPHLVVKLEEIVSGLREVGVDVPTLGILAGFRSPAYNSWKKKMGGVGGKYTKGLSTHMYGCAADFYVDADGDGAMDDLNGDGTIDMEDAAWVRDRVVDAVDCRAEASSSGLAGMCGVYGEHDVPDRATQTPNLHVDVRVYSLNRWYINPRDEMVTDWEYWERRSCQQVLGTATPELGAGR